MYWLVIVGQILMLVACAAKSTIRDDCISESQAQNLLATLSPSLLSVTAPGQSTASPQLVEAQCTKRVYMQNGYRAVVYRKAGAKELSASMGARKERETAPAECLSQAQAMYQHWQLSYVEALFELYQRQSSSIWLDADVGPSKWLECRRESSPSTRDSLATLAHEVNHEVNHPPCFYVARESTYRCLELDSSLPPRSVARMAEMPVEDAQVAQVLRRVQDLYLPEREAWGIFDELNSYTLTLQVMTANLKRDGRLGLYTGQSRPLVLLPLFLVYTLRYLQAVHAADADLFLRDFGRATGNWVTVEALLHQAENSYQEWRRTLNATSSRELAVEKNLWAEYLRLRAWLYLTI